MMQLDEEGFIQHRRLSDKRRLCVEPLLFGRACLGIGMLPPLHNVGVYADTWEFPSVGAALLAFGNWQPDRQKEPDGWDRNVATMRYRIEGKRELEYIKSNGESLAQAQNAMQVMQIEFAYMIYDENEIIGRSFPDGTQRFRVIGSDEDYTIFQYLDRCVVLTEEETRNVSLTTIIKRLTE